MVYKHRNISKCKNNTSFVKFNIDNNNAAYYTANARQGDLL